ncbi:transcription factor bHLH18 isoform X2 [Spinacia oleracea]|nr:transcription factor bHLH18-like isoform X2 [Spinacia oleracea]
MDVNPVLYHQYDHHSKTMEASLDEQLAATLGDDFPYPLYNVTRDIASPQEDFDCDLIEQFILSSNINDDNNNNNDGDNIVSLNVQENQPLKKKKETKKQAEAVSVSTKRKRQPSQVQDHIMAERKRRELLSQLFISLSALVPNLKKIDKTTVLGEAIKHMKQLQEKVKALEGVVAAKKTVESVVVVKKSKVMVGDNGSSDDNVSSSTVGDYTSRSSGSSGDGNGNGGGSGGCNDLQLPEIQVKTMGNTLLSRIYCEKHNGILAKLFTKVDKHNLSITSFSVIPFESFALDITIAAQMEDGFNRNVNDFVRSLHSAIRSPSIKTR